MAGGGLEVESPPPTATVGGPRDGERGMGEQDRQEILVEDDGEP